MILLSQKSFFHNNLKSINRKRMSGIDRESHILDVITEMTNRIPQAPHVPRAVIKQSDGWITTTNRVRENLIHENISDVLTVLNWKTRDNRSAADSERGNGSFLQRYIYGEKTAEKLAEWRKKRGGLRGIKEPP